MGFARYAYNVQGFLANTCTMNLPVAGRHLTALVAVFTEELSSMQAGLLQRCANIS